MKHITSILLITLSLLVISCGQNTTKNLHNTQNNINLSNKQKAIDFLKTIETNEKAPLSYAGEYKQHNLAIPTGLDGLLSVVKLLPPNSAKVNTVRAFEDGDYVFTHTSYDFFGPKVGFDIFRFENGKIAEHWDNLQVDPKTPNPSNRTMTDGNAFLKDLHKTSQNKILAKNFVTDILIEGNMDKLKLYDFGDNYLQHNPIISDHLSGLKDILIKWKNEGISIAYHKIHKVLGEGNFVLVASEGEFGGKPTAFYDLFRIENGVIAEHWDTIEEIPAKGDWKNNNGKF